MAVMYVLIIFILFAVIVGICCAWGFATRAIGKSRGKDNCFWWGFFLGLIGLIIVLCITNDSTNSNNKEDRYESSEIQ